MRFIFPANTETQIDAIRDAIGRDVTFYRNIGNVACAVSGCSLDPVTNKSTNSFCPVCSGNYWIPQISGTVVTAKVKWRGSDQATWYTAGKVFDGDCQLQISSGNSYLLDAIYVGVDDEYLIIKKTIPKGVPELNRVIVILEEKT